jgi:hypothetical protein
MSHTVTSQNSPGPGTYDLGTTIGKSRSVSLKGRNFASLKQETPGPGAYEDPRRLGDTAPKYSLSGRIEFTSKVQQPGPGAYNHHYNNLGKSGVSHVFGTGS